MPNAERGSILRETDVLLEKEEVSPLSLREIEVLLHLSRGFSNKEIARELGIGKQTVKNHTYNIFKKLNVDGRGAAALIFQQTLSVTYQKNSKFNLEDFESTLLKTAQAKESLVPASALSHFEELLKTELTRQKEKVTRRETAIILLLAQEISYKEIAANLRVPFGTIRTNISRLYKRFDIDGQNPRRRELLIERARKAWKI